MKKCPQCNTVYENETIYCLNDGAPVVEESFSLPSATGGDDDDEPTLIRSKPIIIDIAAADEQQLPPITDPPIPPFENVILVPAAAASSNRNYALFLVVGLLVGGGLVLGTLLLSKNYYQNENTAAAVKTNANYSPVVKTEKSNSSPGIQDKNEIVLDGTISNKHAAPNDAAGENSNGRVIVPGARVRSAPDKNAAVVDTIPMGDRLDIIRRENSNSPWYQVECEHGAGGWMHGDTIEFTR